MFKKLDLPEYPSDLDIDKSLEREIFRVLRLRVIFEEFEPPIAGIEDDLRDAQRIVVNAVRLAKQANHTAALICDAEKDSKKGMHSDDLGPLAKKRRVTAEQREWLQQNWHLFEGEARLIKQMTHSLESTKVKRGRSPKLDCAVCFAEERSFCYVPCGHKCVCAECARHPSCETRCPICKAEGKPMRVFDA